MQKFICTEGDLEVVVTSEHELFQALSSSNRDLLMFPQRSVTLGGTSILVNQSNTYYSAFVLHKDDQLFYIVNNTFRHGRRGIYPLGCGDLPRSFSSNEF